MTLLILILIAIPVCILTILLWIYNDYKKYKRQNCISCLLFLALPATIQAQYTDKNCCVNSKWYENPKEILEHTAGSFTNFPWLLTINHNSSIPSILSLRHQN